MEMAKLGEVDVTIRPTARADASILAESFDIKNADRSLFKAMGTLTSFTERLNELIRNGDGFFWDD